MLNGDGGELSRLLDQCTFGEGRPPRKAAIGLERAEKLRFDRKDRRTTEGGEPERYGTPLERMEGVFRVIREQHHRDHVSQLNVDRRAHSVQDLGQRRTLGNQLQQLTFTRQQGMRVV